MVALKGNGDFVRSPHRYELIDKDGNVVGTDSSAILLADLARVRWPDQEQDEERSGKGWDVQVVGADR